EGAYEERARAGGGVSKNALNVDRRQRAAGASKGESTQMPHPLCVRVPDDRLDSYRRRSDRFLDCAAHPGGKALEHLIGRGGELQHEGMLILPPLRTRGPARRRERVAQPVSP